MLTCWPTTTYYSPRGANDARSGSGLHEKCHFWPICIFLCVTWVHPSVDWMMCIPSLSSLPLSEKAWKNRCLSLYHFLCFYCAWIHILTIYPQAKTVVACHETVRWSFKRLNSQYKMKKKKKKGNRKWYACWINSLCNFTFPVQTGFTKINKLEIRLHKWSNLTFKYKCILFKKKKRSIHPSYTAFVLTRVTPELEPVPTHLVYELFKNWRGILF